MFDPQGLTDAGLVFDRSVRDTARQVAIYREVLTLAASDPAIEGA